MLQIATWMTVVLTLIAASGCCARRGSNDSSGSSTSTVSTTPVSTVTDVPTALPLGPDVPFKGMYRKHAESVFKNGRRLSSPTTKGTGSLNVESGKVTYSQIYPNGSQMVHVTQIYTFTADSVKPAANGGYAVQLTFLSMDSDSKTYIPDRRNPRLDVVKSVKGWEIGLITTDDKGVMAGSEFDPI